MQDADKEMETDDFGIGNTEARGLTGVKPLAESNRGVRLAVGSLADGRPDSCKGRKDDVKTTAYSRQRGKVVLNEHLFWNLIVMADADAT